jgi:glycosyltransferase involved in cell wall biosynthesis
MSDSCLASIIVVNYNYARFIREAIDSALGQTYLQLEVLVVDDGSTDESRAIIASYGERVRAVLKENGGMGSAWNAGFAASRGDAIFFLDSDDLLLPTAVERAVEYLRDPAVAKVHWPLLEIDQGGKRSGKLIPPPPLPDGDFRAVTVAQGPDSYVSPPTTGNGWSRRFAEKVLPMPAGEFRQHSDTYLYTLAPLFGMVKAVQAPQGCYRVHGNNDYASRPAEEKNRRNLEIFERRCHALSGQLERLGQLANLEGWKQGSTYYAWMRRLQRAIEDVKSVVPAGAEYILVDDAQWSDGWGGSAVIAGRKARPFLEKNGQFWGPPADDATAISELERMRGEGAAFVVFAWSTFWWLQHYGEFALHLRAGYSCVLENDGVVVFDLRGSA